MSFARVDALVRAVLYEGYVLYPYRASSLKNQQRFSFGGVYPRAWSEARGGGDPWSIKAECLVVGDDARVTAAARFLQLVERVEEPGAAPWHEAIERTVEAPGRGMKELVAAPEAVRFAFDALVGELALRATPVEGAHRLTLELRNLTPFAPVGGASRHAARDAALLCSLASAHALLEVEGGALVSLMDPPEALRDAAAACENVGVWPVLVGEPGRRDAMLASPIILEDYPRLAPESAGDLFDATEIDEILVLRILTLTDAEKAEMRALDPRSRALLDRCLALGPDALARLHGGRRASARAGELGPGDRVRLRPRARGDVLDLALAGMSATIASVERDYEGRVHLAVTVDADPGRDLGLTGQPGHRFFFGRDEVEPLP
jgi:hypothetical protein